MNDFKKNIIPYVILFLLFMIMFCLILQALNNPVFGEDFSNIYEPN